MSDEAFQQTTPVEPSGQTAPEIPQVQAPQVPDVNGEIDDDDGEPVAPQLSEAQQWLQQVMADPEKAELALQYMQTGAQARNQPPPPPPAPQNDPVAQMSADYNGAKQAENAEKQSARWCDEQAAKCKADGNHTYASFFRLKAEEHERNAEEAKRYAERVSNTYEQYQATQKAQADHTYRTSCATAVVEDVKSAFQHVRKEDLDRIAAYAYQAAGTGRVKTQQDFAALEREIAQLFGDVFQAQPQGQQPWQPPQSGQRSTNNLVQFPVQGAPGGGGGRSTGTQHDVTQMNDQEFEKWIKKNVK